MFPSYHKGKIYLPPKAAEKNFGGIGSPENPRHIFSIHQQEYIFFLTIHKENKRRFLGREFGEPPRRIMTFHLQIRRMNSSWHG